MSIRLTTTATTTTPTNYAIHNKIARLCSYFVLRIISVPFNNRTRTTESNGIEFNINWIFCLECDVCERANELANGRVSMHKRQHTYVFYTDNGILCIEYGNFADELQKCQQIRMTQNG